MKKLSDGLNNHFQMQEVQKMRLISRLLYYSIHHLIANIQLRWYPLDYLSCCPSVLPSGKNETSWEEYQIVPHTLFLKSLYVLIYIEKDMFDLA